MPIVIQRRREPNGWEQLGLGVQRAVDKYLQGNIAMADQSSRHARDIMGIGMMGSRMKREERMDAQAAQKDTARAKAGEVMEGIDFKSPDAAQQLLRLSAEAPDLVGPSLQYLQQQRQFEAAERARAASESRHYASLNKPQYDQSRGGFVRPDGTFQPLQMPEGYVPQERIPQKTYADIVKEGYASAMGVPEDQRTDVQRQAITLGQVYGIKPQGAGGELEVLPLDTSARKEAFELRNQWDEAERVQHAFDEFEAGGGQGGTGLLLGALPATISNRIDPGGTALRGSISQMSSVIMNALSGAAVSEQERKRLEGFLPTSSDDLPTVQRKLEGYRDYLSTKTDSWRKMYGGVKPLEGIQRKPEAQQQRAAPTGGGTVIRYDSQGRRLQ